MSRASAEPAGEREAALLVGHGSRREKSNEQVRQLAAMLERRLGVPTDAAFLELAEPAIEAAVDVLAPGVGSLTVLQCSLFAASHVKQDVPLAIDAARRSNPELTIANGAHLGVHPAMLEIVADRVAAVTGHELDGEESSSDEDGDGSPSDDIGEISPANDGGETEPEVTGPDSLDVDPTTDDVAVVLCGRGSSDPDANGDLHKLARLFYEGRPYDPVEAAFLGVTEPELPETLQAVVRHRPDAVVVVPYMLGDGVLTERIREQTRAFDDDCPYVDLAPADPLGTDERLVTVLADRYETAQREGVAMSCDTCKYKVELAGHEDDVGGAAAALRARQHRAEHADRDDVADEPHAHDAPARHVAVCTNTTCSRDGASAVLERLRKRCREADVDVQVTRTSCLGQCGDGPMVAVNPDGVWYGGVDESDADRIVDDHCLDDELVGDLIEATLY